MAKRSGFLLKDTPQNLCGPQIRKLREARSGDRGRHLTQEELASRVQEIYGVSMSPAQLSKIEVQKKHVLDVQLQAIADALEVKVCTLFPEKSGHDKKS
jgi:hypothetical protein